MASKATNEERRAQLSTWINGIDTQGKMEAALKLRYEGTCEWVFDSQEFKEWEGAGGDRGRLLWIYGPPGFGKTVLSASIIKHLKSKGNGSVAYFFCGGADTDMTRDPHAILRSWLAQVLDEDDEVIRIAEATFGTRKKSAQLTHLQLWQLFSAIGAAVPGVVFVVDGFDECADIDSGIGYHNRDPRKFFLRDLVQNMASTKARVLVVSRDVPDIREWLSKGGKNAEADVEGFEYEITANDTTADVKAFTHYMVDQKLPRKKEALRRHLASQAAERSGGMFLWVELLGQGISRGMNKKELETKIRDMPSRISETYARELERISKLEAHERQKAVALLRWLLFAVNPLQMKQLAEALVVSDSGIEEYPFDDLPDEWEDGFVDEYYVEETVLKSCGALVRLRSSHEETPLAEQTIHFVHLSVREYLLSQTDHGPWADWLSLSNRSVEEAALSKVCLRYLNLEIFREVPSSTHLFPFLDYAAWAWYFHSFHERPAPAEEIVSHTKRAFDPTTDGWKVWTPILETRLSEAMDGDPLYPSEENAEYSDDERELEWTSSTSSDESNDVALSASDDEDQKREEKEEEDVNEEASSSPKETQVRNPVYYASLLGLKEVVKWLLEQGLDAACVGGRYGFPLQAAAAGGHTDVVAYLIHSGAPVRQVGGEFGTALMAAATQGTLEVVRALAKAGGGEHVQHRDGRGRTALDHAARRGDSPMVHTLLDHGAVVTQNAVEYACSYGHADVLRFLLARGEIGFDMGNSRHVQAYRTALRDGHFEAALVVLETLDADVIAAPLLSGWTLLHGAVRYQVLPVLHALLHNPDPARRAEVNRRDSEGLTVLGLACAVGNLEVVRALLDAGADLTTEEGEIPPLTYAVSNTNLAVIRHLCDLGVDKEQKCSGFVTPLLLAVERRYIDAARLLLDLGAIPQGINEHSQSSLVEHAVEAGQEVMARMLVERGCFRSQTPDPRVDEPEQALPLLVYECGHSEGPVQEFMACKGVVRMDQETLGEALRIAAFRGYDAVVRYLASLGATASAALMNSKDTNGRTALHHAAAGKHWATCDFLTAQGARVSVEDNIGSTPIDLAVRHGSVAMPFITAHMEDMFDRLTRRPSILEATHGMDSGPSPSAVRRALTGHWTGHYEYLEWRSSTREETTLKVSGTSGAGKDGFQFSGSNSDLYGPFMFQGFVDPKGFVWWVKLYQNESAGWLYKGRLSPDLATLKGTWGGNRKLWYGTFVMTKVKDELC
ncbi:uncharacterized protein PG998_012941 [Apiospora kogelbergensis]|uniref:uncharacterized protein n=1 Tax=Apiospora kogelbergensis TaxID=1337665 RepID=UPI003130E0B3